MPAILLALLIHLAATPQDPEQQLLAADRAFAKATAERRLDGWMEFMAADVARLEKIGAKFIKGKEAVKKADSVLFANPKRCLVWEPVDAHHFADHKSGVTTGRYRVITQESDGKEVTLSQGAYVTGWRKEPSGQWKVIFDTGTPDIPATKKE